ncbi:MAG: GGDEF domain-containing protein [Oscillospiraceae bacterium]|nr:GGDEF domain-containing protein [Oscillospiraceae bacterium]
MGKRLTIGFMIHHLDNDYSKSVLNGAAAAAKELDVDLAIFPGRSLNSQLDDKRFTVYEYQNNVVYSYVSSKMLDAAVVSAGTVGSFVTPEEFKRFLDGYRGLPIITMENKVEGYPCVRLSGSGIKDLVEHLIKKHGRKNIAFVSGPKGNSDAEERLGYYKEALSENGIEFDPNMVAYGKFSEYCVDIVGDLIDRNEGKIDAICFANDMMCKGGYKAIERRGLRVGTDIAVTGYDDSEVAVSLRPRLTTIRADASALGYRAVAEAVRLAKKEAVQDISLGSSPVFRFSCGCKGQAVSFAEKAASRGEAAIKITDMILSDQIQRYDELLGHSLALSELRRFLCDVLEFAQGNGGDEEMLSKSVFLRLLNDETIALTSPEMIIRIARNIRIAAKTLCEENAPERMIIVDDITENLTEAAAERIIGIHYSKVEDITFTHFLISNITKDMTIYGNNVEKCFFAVVNNLYRAHVDSSYIYVYEEPVVHGAKSSWVLPDTVLLKAYHDGDKLSTVTGEAQKISSSAILDNMYTPAEKRRTTVVFPLYMNEEQYGVMVFEMENEFFPYIYSITPQICTAIKLINLVTQLENSIDQIQSRNNQLSRMSMSDELTGIYNRRGFYVFANRILKAPENEGRQAVVIFGDLDNLKKINDTFGHEDGDYAIVTVANVIKSSLRNSDVVARIGGDEFAAFAICDDREIALKLPERIKSIAAAHNQSSSKPYNVTVSVGIVELICAPELNIQQYMDQADTALYEDKKRKNPDIMKK